MATVSTPGAPEPPINRLPIEVLQDVFHKVAQRSETIRHIRLTCRYWRDLVTSDLTLPRRIVIHHMIGEMDTRSHHSAMGDYCTHTLGGLAKALGYIQDAMFHLDLRLDKVLSSKDEEYDKVPWSRFQTQCTSLAVYSTDKTVGYFVNFLGHFVNPTTYSSQSSTSSITGRSIGLGPWTNPRCECLPTLSTSPQEIENVPGQSATFTIVSHIAIGVVRRSGGSYSQS
ncbi:hypothetical protein FRC18_007893 [Serendipita sp. 400]|nr:hypothetical protein FRC18_007893 [Serendipita sp. 400]